MDNSNGRDTGQVILAVQRAAFLMDPFFKIAATGTALLLTWFLRLRKEKRLKKGEFKNLCEFMKATDGNYYIVNVPVTDGWLGQNSFDKELANLRELGVRYKLLPDLNARDGFEQLMIHTEDKEIFDGWFGKYLATKMQGGQHELRNLKNLTNEKTSIVSIPFEGKEREVFEDFEKLGVNYAVLPDLHVGDGEIQMIVANNDMPMVEEWFKLYTSDRLKAGNEVPEMKCMKMDDYTKSGEMTEEEYIDTSSDELKKAVAKYEGQEPGEIEKYVQRQEQAIRSQADESYEKLHKDPQYQEITINREQLVENSMFAGTEVAQRAQKSGLFLSRVPGTYGKNERTLLLPTKQVFLSDNGKTYIGFMEKQERQLIIGPDGKPLPGFRRMSGNELFENHYSKVERRFRQKEVLSDTAEKAADRAEEQVQKKAVEKCEGKEPGEIEKYVQRQEQAIRSQSDAAYEELHKDRQYLEITINREQLVENSMFAGTDVAWRAQEAGLFVSRVPGTYGKNELTLLLPTNQVFLTDDGKTYIGFLETLEKQLVIGPDGKPLPGFYRMSGNELFENHYSKVESRFQQEKTLSSTAKKTVDQAEGKVRDKVMDQAAKVPVKVK